MTAGHLITSSFPFLRSSIQKQTVQKLLSGMHHLARRSTGKRMEAPQQDERVEMMYMA